MRNKILDLLRKATGIEKIVLDVPKERAFGDYSINIAMALAKEQKKSPRIVAQEIKEKIEKEDNGCLFSKVEIAGPGFINLFIKEGSIVSVLAEILKAGDSFGASDTGQQKRVLLEYVSANPTGPLHIGHGRWAAIGDSISNIMKFAGFNVHTEFYVNNAGKQINLLIQSVNASKAGLPTPEGGYGGQYIKDIASKNSDDVLGSIIQNQKETLNNARVLFDEWFYESKLHDEKQLDMALEKLKINNAVYEKDGAVWFRSEQYGDDKDRVLIRENGEPTYFMADIAYHYNKIQRGYESLVNVWGQIIMVT